jgi:hypothetical protein
LQALELGAIPRRLNGNAVRFAKSRWPFFQNGSVSRFSKTASYGQQSNRAASDLESRPTFLFWKESQRFYSGKIVDSAKALLIVMMRITMLDLSDFV